MAERQTCSDIRLDRGIEDTDLFWDNFKMMGWWLQLIKHFTNN